MHNGLFIRRYFWHKDKCAARGLAIAYAKSDARMVLGHSPDFEVIDVPPSNTLPYHGVMLVPIVNEPHEE